MKEIIFVILFLAGYVLSPLIHDSDIVRNCKNNGQTTLLNGTKIKCVVVKE